ncbi:MAG: hypothetical protein FJ026_10130 [Chloroflexi bacterium]|nr:hypothetical protein [Chloroflexota bacterium]
MNKVAIGLIAAVVLAAVAGGAFYAGTKVGENRALENPATFFRAQLRGQAGQFQGLSGTPVADQFPGASGMPQSGLRGIQAADGGLLGSIERIDGNTLVVSTDEGSIRVQASDTTLIEKYMTVEVADLVVGERIIISGSQNDDGSYNARSIQSLRAVPSFDSGQLPGR